MQKEIEKHVKEALEKFPEKIKEYHNGKVGLLGLFVGEAMKLSRGTADPKELNEAVIKSLSPSADSSEVSDEMCEEIFKANFEKFKKEYPHVNWLNFERIEKPVLEFSYAIMKECSLRSKLKSQWVSVAELDSLFEQAVKTGRKMASENRKSSEPRQGLILDSEADGIQWCLEKLRLHFKPESPIK